MYEENSEDSISSHKKKEHGTCVQEIHQVVERDPEMTEKMNLVSKNTETYSLYVPNAQGYKEKPT